MPPSPPRIISEAFPSRLAVDWPRLVSRDTLGFSLVLVDEANNDLWVSKGWRYRGGQVHAPSTFHARKAQWLHTAKLADKLEAVIVDMVRMWRGEFPSVGWQER